MSKRPAIQRFEEKYIPEPNSGCWLWTGTVTYNGYGIFEVNGKKIRAHRFSYELHKGPIPDGLTIDHLCRVRCCVNPDHLEAVTMRENTLRGYGISAQNARKTHCIYGHPLSGENIRVYKRPGRHQRICKTCQKMAVPVRRAQKKAPI